MLALVGVLVVGIGLMAVVDPCNGGMVYDGLTEKMVYIPDRRDVMLELLLLKN